MSCIKQRLKNGESLIGTLISIVEHADTAKIIKASGFDYMLIDNEHGAFDYSALANMCTVSKAIGFPAIIRIPEPNRECILKYMDMGAAGLMIPNCESAETAKKVVQYSKYAPLGNRGLSFARTHSDYVAPVSAEEYMRQTNEQTIILCQIESPVGVENVNEILSVDGVDVCFVGPYDLSQSYNLLGQFTHPTITGAIEKVVEAAKAKNKFSGIYFSGSTDLMKHWMEKGMTLNLWSNEVSLLIASSKEALLKLRG